MELTLTRTIQNDRVTIGRLDFPALSLFTLEPPWRENARNVSCIPPGSYTCERYSSAKYGKTFAVTGVPNRSGILFHVGNWVHDTQGCILVGLKHTPASLIYSKRAMDVFRAATEHVDSFMLHVTN